MAIDVSSAFQEFLARITLGERQVERMNSAFGSVAAFLSQSYGLSDGLVFLQGSYANHTAVKPVEGGEYDVDVVAVCVDGATSADDALHDLEQRFRENGSFAERVVVKKPCVRLEYAEDEVGNFHVDVVPTRVGARAEAPLDAPRRNEGWHGTAPERYTDWCRQQGDLFARTVKMLKRWRSEQQSVRGAIKSIVLQVLISDCMPHAQDDASRVAETFRAMHQRLAGLAAPPSVPNPVLPNEDLARSWTKESFESFVRELGEAADWAEEALAAESSIEAADRWHEVFGEDFPAPSAAETGIQLDDYSHAETPEQRGWRRRLDPTYRIEVTARVERGRRRQNRRRYHGRLLPAGQKLRFRAKVRGTDAQVWWQVANTGAHAQREGQLRGEIFEAKELDGSRSRDPTVNWERTAFTGSHLIRALLVRDGVLLAESEWFRVNIAAT